MSVKLLSLFHHHFFFLIAIQTFLLRFFIKLWSFLDSHLFLDKKKITNISWSEINRFMDKIRNKIKLCLKFINVYFLTYNYVHVLYYTGTKIRPSCSKHSKINQVVSQDLLSLLAYIKSSQVKCPNIFPEKNMRSLCTAKSYPHS